MNIKLSKINLTDNENNYLIYEIKSTSCDYIDKN